MKRRAALRQTLHKDDRVARLRESERSLNQQAPYPLRRRPIEARMLLGRHQDQDSERVPELETGGLAAAGRTTESRRQRHRTSPSGEGPAPRLVPSTSR